MTTATLNSDVAEQGIASALYCKGRAAFLAGKPNSDNPRKTGDGRLEWFCGWFDVKEEMLLYGRRKTAKEAYASYRRGRVVFKA